MAVEFVKEWKSFEGMVQKFRHLSTSTHTTMTFSLFKPKDASESNPVSALFFLGGLTCTDDNACIKSGIQRYAAQYNIAIIFPDTSPRPTTPLPEECAHWDFGISAGYYVNATQAPYKDRGFFMYDYISKELPALLVSSFPWLNGKFGISGHSMGGLGALQIGLKNYIGLPNGKFHSITAFAPIAHPSVGPWGIKAFTNFFGDEASNKETWNLYDPTEVARAVPSDVASTIPTILIHQGSADEWLHKGELCPDDFIAAAKSANLKVDYTLCDGYEHGYFFVGTFLESHISHHAKVLNGA
jgi:S-formylglutathione hydrolase